MTATDTTVIRIRWAEPDAMIQMAMVDGQRNNDTAEAIWEE